MGRFALTPIKSAHLDVETIPFRRLAEFWELNAKSVETHEHTVAWIDCTAKDGRGIFSRGNWRGSGDLSPHASRSRLSVPVEAPSWALNSLTVRTFNRAYFAAQAAQPANRSLHYAPFFYPLDGVAHWNRLYGRRGFWQYQCVVPTPTMVDAIACLLDAIAASGQGSFLAVLKTFGAMEFAWTSLVSDARRNACARLSERRRTDASIAGTAQFDRVRSRRSSLCGEGRPPPQGHVDRGLS